jgi:hypothetical protein
MHSRAFAPIAVLVALAVALPRVSHAEPLLLESPGDHPRYRFEAEPHGLLGFGSIENGALGIGFRGTFVLADPGFVTTVNDTAGISIGADYFVGRSRSNALFVPIQAHWSFFFSQHWSGFVELGVGLRLFDNDARISPALSIGGRYHVTERVAVTLRLGYPAIGIGASFFL